MRSKWNSTVSSILGSLLVSATAVVQADTFDAVRMQIRDAMVEQNIPAVAVAVAHKGKIVWEEGFGFADASKRTPASAHTAFSLASVSKPVTATALMMLVERGAIDLDKPLNDYLSSQKLSAHGGAAQPTIRQVANHTSGLPLHYQFFYEDETAVRPPMDESIRRHGTLVRPPGEAFAYSNFGYGLLEYVIERTSGQSYAQFLQEELFGPLGLTESSVNRRAGSGSNVALRYRNGRAVPFYDFDHRGASAVFMSAHDLVRFGMFHLGHLASGTNPVLERAVLAAMADKAAAVPVGDDRTSYGIGWFITEQHGLKAVGHSGGMAGVSTILTLYPDADVVIAVLGNGTGNISGLEGGITHALLPDTIRHDHGFKPDNESVGKWAGALHTYAGQVAIELDIRENGSVFAKVGARPAEEVVDVKFNQKTSVLTFGRITGDVGTPDANRYPYRLYFTLKRRTPNTLNGAVSAISRPLPDRSGNALSYWVELTKE